MAMGGKHPISIITDQDKAMQGAIEQVFPNATHRSCLFHIKKKAEEKVGPASKLMRDSTKISRTLWTTP